MEGCFDKRFEEMLSPWELDMLDESERQELELHVLQCESCRKNLLEFQQAAKLLQQDTDVRARVRDALAGNSPLMESATRGKRRLFRPRKLRPSVVPAFLVAAIIVLLLVLKPWQIEIHPTDEAVAGANRVAVMYFENIADRDDPERLADIATNLLITDLSESSHLKVLSGQRLNDILELHGIEHKHDVDKETIAEVASETETRWVIVGSILQVEPYMVMTVQLSDMTTGEITASEKVSGGIGEDIFSMVDKLAVEIRNELAPTVAVDQEHDRNLTDLTTSSPEAYRYFLKGLEFRNKVYQEEAKKSFRQAVEIDPTFAAAYYYLSLYLTGSEQLGALSKAVQYSDNTSQKVQAYIGVRAAEMEGNIEGAIEELLAVLEQDPTDKDALLNLALYEYRLGRFEQSIQHLNEAIKIDPRYRMAYNSLAYSYFAAGDLDKSLWATDQYISIAPGEANPFDTKGEILYRSGRIDDAIESFEKALEYKSDLIASWSQLVELLTFMSEYKRAENVLRRATANDSKPAKSRAEYYRAMMLVRQGKFTMALISLDSGMAADAEGQLRQQQLCKLWLKVRILADVDSLETALQEIDRCMVLHNAVNPDDILGYHHYHAQLLALAGSLDEAERHALSLKEDLQDTIYGSFGYLYAMGFVDLARAHPGQAATRFRELQDRLPGYFPVQYMLATAYLEEGESGKAAREYEQLLSSYSFTRLDWGIWNVRIHYYLGQAYEEADRTDDAILQYKTFLDIWKNADSGIREIDDARERLEQLTSRS